MSTTSLSDSERRKSIGTALFSRILRDAGVENLHSLDERWRKNLIPKESEEGRKLCSDLEEYDTVFASRKRMSKQMIDSFLAPSPLIRKKAPSLTLDQERERSPQKKVRKNPKNVFE